MTMLDIAKALLLALGLMALNIAVAFAVVAAYSYLADPGHDAAYYEAAAERIAPWSSVAFGIPLFLIAALEAAKRRPARRATVFAMTFAAIYIAIDAALLSFAGSLLSLGGIVPLSYGTKLLGGVGRRSFGCKRYGLTDAFMTLREEIERSLELVAEHGDPADRVYARLFAAHPDMEALFVRDKSGAIRGNMLAEAIKAVLDFAGDNHYGANLMRAEIVNHEHLGVPPANFCDFFTSVRDSFAEILGPAWSAEIDAAWGEILTRIADALR